jgi:hypothetical protein
MSTTLAGDWYEANQRYLSMSLAALRDHLGQTPGEGGEKLQRLAAEMAEPPALEAIRRLFTLSAFEREILLLCAGVELSADFAQAIAALPGAGSRGEPTFSLALDRLAEAHWSALTPVAPLRYWRLITVDPGGPITASPLRIDERILHYLSGVSYLDERLAGVADSVHPPPPAELPASHCELAHRLAWTWHASQGEEAGGPALLLTGTDPHVLRDVAAVASAMCGLGLYAVRASDIPTETQGREELARLWEREAKLTTCAVLIDWDEPASDRAAVTFVETLAERVVIAARDPVHIPRRPSLHLRVAKLASEEQRSLWHSAIQELGEDNDEAIRAVAGQFSLSGPAIRMAALEIAQDLARDPERSLSSTLWDVSRRRSHARLDDLAQRLDTAVEWEDLVLPERQLAMLREIAVHVRQRTRVYEEWGFARKNSRGLGLSALFAGASGTGKTLAAEVIANTLRLDLYRIDLSAVVSKYIGETEKNLRRIFDAAEDCGAILLFDEADALFGKRSDVKDSHDRYANLEVSYLLQRMEMYGGLAILTTNMKDALDGAFLRRIRFIVPFPFPDAEQRAEIWRRIFPREMPQYNLDPQRLAQLHLSGGHIRNIAMHAAFLAAEDDQRVGMEHLLRAAGSEYAKLEKSLTEAETRGWLSP